jgi:hypothetical protein
MIKRTFIAVFLLTSFFSMVEGQKLYFCERYSTSGEPINISNKWVISDSGGGIYFLFKPEKGAKGGLTYFYIDQKQGDSYKENDVRELNIGDDAGWVVMDYKVKEPGEYKITVLDKLKNILATEVLSVSVKESKTSPAYYKNMITTFCKKVEDGAPVDAFSELTLPESGEASVSLLMKHDKPMKSFRLIVDVWTVKDDKLDEFVESLTVDADTDELLAELEYTIFSKGEYRFMIYNNESVFMKGASLVVKGN